MIGYLEGRDIGRQENRLLLLTSGGVGYEIFVPSGFTGSAIKGDLVGIHVTTVVRENEIVLYGFDSPQSKSTFELLLKASGVGPKMALNFLSVFSVGDLVSAVLNQDIALLSSVPGVGKKTAARLCVELSDRMSQTGQAVQGSPPMQADLISALTNLGYPEKDVLPVVRQLAGADMELTEQIKKALALIKR